MSICHVISQSSTGVEPEEPLRFHHYKRSALALWSSCAIVAAELLEVMEVRSGGEECGETRSRTRGKREIRGYVSSTIIHIQRPLMMKWPNHSWHCRSNTSSKPHPPFHVMANHKIQIETALDLQSTPTELSYFEIWLWLPRVKCMKMEDEMLEAKNMVKSFRVSELQSLLSLMGHSKSGLKQDLLDRSLKLLWAEFSPQLMLHIRQLYESRFPKAPAAGCRSEEPSPPCPAPAQRQQGTVHLNGLPKHNRVPSPKPAATNEIKLVPLPFYQTLDTILPPMELMVEKPSVLQEGHFAFELSSSQVEQIRNCRELRPSIKSIQVVLRICYKDASRVQEDQYPPNIGVKVNSFSCHVPGYYPSNKVGVEPRRPCVPVDITSLLRLSTATNRILVSWGNFGKRYCVSLHLVRVFTAADLFAKLCVESAECCRERIQEKLRFDPENEVATTGLCVSLICPLVKMRLGVPCRVLTCAHLQCFDAMFFLQMNEKKPTWTCPVCDKPAPYEMLTIDGLLSEILKETQDVDEIEYLADGSWRPITEEKRERSSAPECPVLDISSTEANGHSPARSVAIQCGAKAPPAAAPSPAPLVIVDLTEDTLSEEEEGEITEETDDSQDDPPPRKGRWSHDKGPSTAC
ncbi:hypothetical protein GJAV_G00109860 [Gymnothorax javanicus]|nr:hypothetical protein GJAV_G00109860 [Gymnothorax javanicus]